MRWQISYHVCLSHLFPLCLKHSVAPEGMRNTRRTMESAVPPILTLVGWSGFPSTALTFYAGLTSPQQKNVRDASSYVCIKTEMIGLSSACSRFLKCSGDKLMLYPLL